MITRELFFARKPENLHVDHSPAGSMSAGLGLILQLLLLPASWQLLDRCADTEKGRRSSGDPRETKHEYIQFRCQHVAANIQ